VSASLSELARRRGQLVGRADAQREAIVAAIERQRVWTTPVETGIALFRIVMAHRLVVLGLAVGMAATRPRGLLRWARRAWAVYGLVSKIRRTLRS